MKQYLLTSWLGLAAAVPRTGQTAPPAGQSSAPVLVTLYLRERTNATQWFAATPNAEQYGHQDSLLRLGIAQRIHRFDYGFELTYRRQQRLGRRPVGQS